MSKKNDNVKHPSHYTVGKIETINIIKDKLTPEQFRGYLIGNCIKYITRYQYKNGIEDLRKMQRYADMLIEFEEDEK